MPWAPELFSAPVLEQIEEKSHRRLEMVPFFDGLLANEPDALIGSFAGEPELYSPIRGRVKGARAFAAFLSDMSSWLREHRVSVEVIEHVTTERDGFEEVVLHFDGEGGRVDLPYAIVGDFGPGRRINELRIYFSNWALAGHHVNRPPLLQPDPQLRESDVVGEYQGALAAGDTEAIVATFEADGYAREPAGAGYVHRGHDGLRSFYAQLFSNGGGISLEHCATIDDGRACALEYNVARWGRTELPPQAGIAVYVRGDSGKLAAARIYDDADPPLAA
ncbi:MAG: nuclear transport factor 2 family protein [Solirubrobacteraceae bacterium]